MIPRYQYLVKSFFKLFGVRETDRAEYPTVLRNPGSRKKLRDSQRFSKNSVNALLSASSEDCFSACHALYYAVNETYAIFAQPEARSDAEAAYANQRFRSAPVPGRTAI
jgi:hypothetical protein